jgi:RimJ/RimL family protein N-acetyltransferase
MATKTRRGSYPEAMVVELERHTRRITLPDGAELLIRQLQPDDKQLLADGLRQLTPETRYRRFFRPVNELADRDLAYLTEIDHHDHEALAAIEREHGQLVGVARYVRGAEPRLAEVSVVVGETWRRKGIATALLERLVERARGAGITHFTALVMDDNTEALKLFESRVPGGARPRRSSSGHLELEIDLPEPGELSGSVLARVLGAAARSAVIVHPYRMMRVAIRRLARE